MTLTGESVGQGGELEAGSGKLAAGSWKLAAETVAKLALRTPVIPSDILSEQLRTPVWLKLESLQVTGSFKVRGAANKMASLSTAERKLGVITCSSGNHGRAVAYVASQMEIPATVVVPAWVDPSKLDGIRRFGADTVLHGETYDEAEERSLAIQRERDLVYVSPFDDLDVIAGQGTIGLELVEQLPGLKTVVVPVSGGGLIAGVAAAVKDKIPDARVIGVSANNARVMYESLRAGNQITMAEEPTLANALAGGIGAPNQHTLALVRDLVDEHVLVSEDEIRDAMRFAVTEQRLIVEGGGAVGLAALLHDKLDVVGDVAVVVSGGNVATEVLLELFGGVSC